jgi:nucleotide-binding universal stress UspA family protein
MKRIVIATDGSACALDAVREGIELAEELDARVTFVSARAPAMAIWGSPVYGMLTESQTQIAQEAIDAAMAVAEEAEIDADFEILDGPVADAIAGLAETVGADMIVVGSRGRGAVQGALFGSVSKALVTRAGCPVLVVKSPKHAPLPA